MNARIQPIAFSFVIGILVMSQTLALSTALVVAMTALILWLARALDKRDDALFLVIGLGLGVFVGAALHVTIDALLAALFMMLLVLGV